MLVLEFSFIGLYLRIASLRYRFQPVKPPQIVDILNISLTKLRLKKITDQTVVECSLKFKTSQVFD